MILSAAQRQKLDESNDQLFYGAPRFVTHVDGGFIENLTQVYATLLAPELRILDLMSSWVSHLPEQSFREVIGHGLNAEELSKNPRFDDFFVQNLNQDLTLPFEAGRFDAILLAVSVQYLQYPEAIFAEIQRVLTPGGVCIASFSNRMFYQKAIAAWRDSSDSEHIRLVKQYFQGTPGFAAPQIIIKQPEQAKLLQWLGIGHRDPFYAVYAYRQ